MLDVKMTDMKLQDTKDHTRGERFRQNRLSIDLAFLLGSLSLLRYEKCRRLKYFADSSRYESGALYRGLSGIGLPI